MTTNERPASERHLRPMRERSEAGTRFGTGAARRGERASRRARARGARTTVLIASLAGGCGALGACSALGGGPETAPAAQLEPAGWLEPEVVLDSTSFADYAERVRALLDAHRLPLDPSDAAREIALSAPREYPPASGCARSRGVALLVHGLSDTAFSMTDVATVLAANCFVARTMLLPGHGTRAGDLLAVDERDWRDAVRHLARQAASEHDTVLLGGVSLGAVLTLDVALEPGSEIDALLALSPAYALTDWRLIRWAPWLRPIMPWVDKDSRDDWARYEAIPMQGIASTVRAKRHLWARLDQGDGERGGGGVEIPWMLVQSRDDGIVDTAANRALFTARAVSPSSLLVEIGRGERPPDLDPTTRWLRGDDSAQRVTGVTHVGVHVSDTNPHYGIGGDYRACGENTGRYVVEVTRCRNGENIWYVIGDDGPGPDGAASARAAFNPAFEALSTLIGEFIGSWVPPLESASVAPPAEPDTARLEDSM